MVKNGNIPPPPPLTPPFRLTRDIVDGMGINGVEGVMRRCCEETLRVLRDNRGSLLTVIEVGLGGCEGAA